MTKRSTIFVLQMRLHRGVKSTEKSKSWNVALVLLLHLLVHLLLMMSTLVDAMLAERLVAGAEATEDAAEENHDQAADANEEHLGLLKVVDDRVARVSVLAGFLA